MAQYYTLEEAARVLQTTPEDLRRMADEKKLRSFRDKGTLRFRSQEIDELARQLGIGSDTDLQLGEVPAPKKGNSPTPSRHPSRAEPPPPAARQASGVDPASSSKRAPTPTPADAEEVFDFTLSLDEEEAQVQLGSLPQGGTSGSKSGKKSKSGPPSPSPTVKPGSDSQVRLAGAGDDLDFLLPLDDSPAPPSPVPGPRTPPTGRKKPSKLSGDSGVRIVSLAPSDSDVKMVVDQPLPDDVVQLGGGSLRSASDSDVRMEIPGGSRGSADATVTEEIDLDAEMGTMGLPTPATSRGTGVPQLPTTSPFELSEEDLQMEEEEARGPTDSSGDFELTPAGADLPPLELASDELPALEIEDDEVSLGSFSPSAGAEASGINLQDPADSGISLEQEAGSDDEIDFELSLDAGTTPPPAKRDSGIEESESEFELSLDDDASSESISAESSEFELSLDDSGSSELELDIESPKLELDMESEEEAPASDSDSEFELTMDDSGDGSPLEEAAEDKDIFETDFDVPALDEESGSEVVALDSDTDLESSDFDLAIDELDAGTEDESGSQVVALEEDEDAEPDAATMPRKKSKTKLLQPVEDEDGNEDFAGIGPVPGQDEEEEEDLPVVGAGARAAGAATKPAPPWGPVPVILMLPCVVVLFLIGLLGFEMVHGMMNYQKTGKFSGLLLQPLTEALTGETLPGSAKKK